MIAVAIIQCTAIDPLAHALYKNASQPIEARVADLLSRMTLAEKAAQLGYSLFGCNPNAGGYIGGCNPWGGHGNAACSTETNKTKCEAHTGSCFWVVGDGGKASCVSIAYNALDGPAVRNAVQQKVMTATRLKIPASFYGETTHCGGARGTTVFPMPCSQGASWNATLVGAIATANALELSSAGGDQALSPILQVATDPRFGRLEENFAEDPFLVGAYGVAAVRGLQGDGGGMGPSTYLPDPTRHVASQAKHFAMYGAGGRDGFTPFGGGVSERTLFEIYLRPWRDVMQLAGARGVMAAHNMIDWLPCHANRRMLTDTLRNRFGLRDGYIGSDCGNVEALFKSFTGFSDSEADGAVLAAEAGVDQDMPGEAFLKLDQSVISGAMSNDTLDRAVSNVLRKKFALRLFDSPYTPEAATANINAPAHRHLALEAARQGTVLLRNEKVPVWPFQPGKTVDALPVDAAIIKKVAVVGPFGGCPSGQNGTACKAKIAMLGGYTAGLGDELRVRVVSVQEAFEERGFDVTYEQGSDGGVSGPGKADQGAAVSAAAESDLALVVIGTMACTCCGKCANGEAGE
jgi:beta-glucosidase